MREVEGPPPLLASLRSLTLTVISNRPWPKADNSGSSNTVLKSMLVRAWNTKWYQKGVHLLIQNKKNLGKGASVYEILCLLSQKLVHLSHVSGFVTG